MRSFTSLFTTSVATAFGVPSSSVSIVSYTTARRRLDSIDEQPLPLSMSKSYIKRHLQLTTSITVLYTVQIADTADAVTITLAAGTPSITAALRSGGFPAASTQVAVVTLFTTSSPSGGPIKSSASSSYDANSNIYLSLCIAFAVLFLNIAWRFIGPCFLRICINAFECTIKIFYRFFRTHYLAVYRLLLL